jgi:hypothetical protein
MKLPFLPKQKDASSARGEYKYVRTLRVFNILIVGSIAGIVLQTMLFMYQNIYQSITRAETIILLKSELGTSGVDFERLRRVSNAWEKKHAPNQAVILRDPFTATPIGTPTGTLAIE